MASEIVTRESAFPHSSWFFFHLKQAANLAVRLSDFATFQELADHLLHAISEGLGVQTCSIHMIDERTGVIQYAASLGLSNECVEAWSVIEIGPDGGWWADAARGARPVIVEDISSFGGPRRCVEASRAAGFRSVWAVPIQTKSGRVLGVFAAYFRESARPTAMESQLAELYVEFAAAAIENARLLEVERRAGEDIEESQARFKILVETARDAIFTVSVDGKITSLNPAFEAITGWRRDEWLGRPFAPLIHRDDLPGALQSFKATLLGEEPPVYELRVLKKSGDYAVGEFVSAPLRFNAEVVGSLGIARDITERKRAQDLLRASEERFSRAFNASPHPVTINAIADGRYIAVNDSFHRVVGFDREEVLGRTLAQLGIWANTGDQARLMEILASQSSVRDWETDFRLKNGETHTFLVSAEVIEIDGERCLLAVSTDINERKRAEAKLRLSEDRFSKTFHANPNPMSITTLDDGRYLDVNDLLLEDTGYTREEIIGRTTLELGLWVDPNNLAKVARLLNAEGSIHNMEARFRMKGGRERVGLFSAEVIELDGRKCVLASLNDITEHKRAEEDLRASEERFFKAFDLNPHSSAIIRLSDGHVLYVNDRFVRTSGYSREEVIGRSPTSMGMWEDSNDRGRILEALEKRGNIRDVEIKVVDKAGRSTVGSLSAGLIDIDGVKCILTTIDDITERKKAEQELRASEERFYKAFNESPQSMSIVGLRDGRYIDVNDSFLRITKHARREVIGHTVKELGIWTDPEDHRAILRKLEEPGSVRDMEVRFTTRDGEIRVCLFSAELIDLGGKQCVLTTTNDITERKQKEDELELARRQWQFTFDAMAENVMLIDNEDRLIRANKTFYTKMGLSPETSIGRTVAELLHGESARNGAESCPICQLRARGEHGVIELPAGVISDYPIYASVDPILNNAGERVGVVEVLRDLSELYSAREEAERERISLTTTIEQMAEGLIVCDPAATVVHANQHAQELFGYTLEEMQQDRNSSLPESRFSDLDENIVAVRDLPVQRALRERRTVENVRLWLNRRDQQRLLLSVTASPFFNDNGVVTGAVALVRDVTEQQREHDRLQQADKLRALGQLASGVAHNFNNALAAVIGYTQLAIRKSKDDEVEKYLKVIEQSAQDAARMVERIHNFSRGRSRVEDFAPVILVGVVRDAVDITRPRWRHDAEAQGIKYDVAVTWEPSNNLKVSGRPSELREVFVNIIFNALDAMPLGGRLDIRGSEDGPFVNVSFTDTGAGMTEETRRRVFEPFFTTKGASGMGMGLSESYRIIERHGGRIDIDTRINQGATFTIVLPIEEVPSNQEGEQQAPPPLARLKILVIDDEALVRGVLAETLIEEGHDVTQAASGEEALGLSNETSFDVVFTDLAMPRTDGIAVAASVKELRPATRVVLMSGYGEDKAYERIGELNCVDGFISKPFNFVEVRRVLGLMIGLPE